MADYIMSESGVLNFANGLFQGRDDKYSCYILIDKTTAQGKEEAKKITEAISQAIVDGTQDQKRDGNTVPGPLAGLNPQDEKQVSRLTLPLKDGDTDTFALGEHVGELRKSVYPEFANHWYLKLNAGSHKLLDEGLIRKVVNGLMMPAVQSDVYSGNLVRANIWFTAYSNNGRKGVQARLNALLITDPGTPLYDRQDRDPFAGFGLPAQTTTSNDPFANMGI